MMKKFSGSVFARILAVLLTILLQGAALVVMFLLFRHEFAWFYAACALLSLAAALVILRQDSLPEYKLAWLVPILLLPIFGGLLYVLFGRVRPTKRERLLAETVSRRYEDALDAPRFAAAADEAQQALAQRSPDAAVQSAYIRRMARAPVFAGTQVRYFPLGEDMFAQLCDDLEHAEKFIFMEYFIIQSGKMWDTLLEILARKAAAGVDVRVLYDDLGCLFLLPANFAQQLEAKGIHCSAFNRFTNIFSSRFNNRDHRKICVVDGGIGYTGGINLADEYINAKKVHGHWKDTAVRLNGTGVWSLTAMFLSLWDFVRGEDEEFLPFAPAAAAPDDGFVQPFTDTPMDDEALGETVYTQLLARAKKSVHITTPYLIIDSVMLHALCAAAKSGVDVHLITPGVPDKKTVYFLTRSYYETLLRAGVKISEYTPGFIHAKSFVADGETAVVGTINLDYRSLYLHYECAVWMHGCAAAADVERDFAETLRVCTPVTLEGCARVPVLKRGFLSFLRLFSPLM